MQEIDTSKSLNVLLAEARLEGYIKAMQIVIKTLGYLSRQPQPKWAKQVAEWVQADIEAMKKEIASDAEYMPAQPLSYLSKHMPK